MDHGYPPTLLLAEDLRHPVVQAARSLAMVTIVDRVPVGWGGIAHAVGRLSWARGQILRAPLAGWVVTVTEIDVRADRGRMAKWCGTAPLPGWTRLIQRFVVGSQEEARGLCAAGVAMGRIVCGGGGVVYGEVGRMRGITAAR